MRSLRLPIWSLFWHDCCENDPWPGRRSPGLWTRAFHGLDEGFVVPANPVSEVGPEAARTGKKDLTIKALSGTIVEYRCSFILGRQFGAAEEADSSVSMPGSEEKMPPRKWRGLSY